ncbi:unnamed protein product, partial [Brassica oleracea var. botrytis]
WANHLWIQVNGITGIILMSVCSVLRKTGCLRMIRVRVLGTWLAEVRELVKSLFAVGRANDYKLAKRALSSGIFDTDVSILLTSAISSRVCVISKGGCWSRSMSPTAGVFSAWPIVLSGPHMRSRAFGDFGFQNV